jgi:enediyne polyketide synthase
MDGRGRVHETWEGLRLTAVNGGQTKGPLIESLLVPYIERRVRELIPGSDISVALIRDGEADRQTRTARALSVALGEDCEVFRRPDGKPEVGGKRSVSAAHHEDLTLAVAGSGAIGCDLEPLVDRPPCVWRALLGDERIALVQVIERRANENPVASATRVWAASECLKKAGVMVNAPFVFLSSEKDSWVLFSAGHFRILTYVAQATGKEEKVVVAILARGV